MKLSFTILSLVALVVLLFLISCTGEDKKTTTSTINTTPVTNVRVTETIVPDLCKDIVCKSGEVCSEGNCACTVNFKKCGNDCITSEKCCTSKDCGSEQICEKNECIDSTACDYLQRWDNTQNKCVCIEKTKWCIDQNKCVLYDKCCDASDCNAEGLITRICKKTDFSPYVCIGDSTSNHCTNVKLNSLTQFKFGDAKKNAIVDKIFSKGTINIKLENKDSRKVPLKTKVQLTDDIWTRVDEITIKGGNCKED